MREERSGKHENGLKMFRKCSKDGQGSVRRSVSHAIVLRMKRGCSENGPKMVREVIGEWSEYLSKNWSVQRMARNIEKLPENCLEIIGFKDGQGKFWRMFRNSLGNCLT